MTTAELYLLRLHAQHLLSPGVNPAADMCGLQAQFLRNAVHALRIRSGKTNVDGLVKTWTLRGTVHLVPECDLPLYLRNCGGAEAICQSGWYRWTAERGQVNPPAREIELARLALEAIAQGIDEREALRLHLRRSLRTLLVAQALRADHTDRRLGLALGTDGAQAPLAEHEALSIGMPVTEVVGVAPQLGRAHVPPQTVTTSIDEMTTGSTGRSCAPVFTEAIVSTT